MSLNGRFSLLTALGLTAGTMLMALALTPKPKPAETSTEAPFRQTAAPMAETPAGQEGPGLTAPCYWIHEQDGMVAVFDADDRGVPLTVTGIAVHTLREADQRMIRGGVLIEGAENLSHFLESFSP